ncbi:MAG: fumarate hydratase [Fibrobacteres bacterium]|nr:fumarate hydratase [Fibrobacterota bacterium]
MKSEFKYEKLLQYGTDKTKYLKLPGNYISVKKAFGRKFLQLKPEALSILSETAFHDIAYYLRATHLKQLAAILKDKKASDNDRYVAFSLLKNAVISAEGVLPMCQDTGTANIIGYKGESIITGIEDSEALSRGVFNSYTKNPLRYSQLVPLSMLEDVNSGSNLPAQIDISAVPGEEYRFLFVAKGGGSANKTSFFAETPTILNEAALTKFLDEKIPAIGVAACPPYHLSIVIGGTSPELNLKVNKMAAAGFLDNLPVKGNRSGIGFRDRVWEKKVMEIAEKCGLGAQILGRYFALDARVIRLPRHAASVHISIGVSCNAHRNAKGKITEDGIYIEALEKNPAKYLKGVSLKGQETITEIDLNRPVAENIKKMSSLRPGALLSLTGPLVVARDIAHARLNALLERNGKVPDYFKNHFVYYAGPAKTPEGMASGSFGPTTAQRMDSYLDSFMKHGYSLVSLAKGNRSQKVTDSCKKYGGFYLGTIGGAAALVAKENISKSEVLDYPELGMEAVRKIEVNGMPAFIISDSRGGNLYAQ